MLIVLQPRAGLHAADFTPRCVNANTGQTDRYDGQCADGYAVMKIEGKLQEGDAATFRDEIDGRTFREYWLISPGGMVKTGLEIGRKLRARKAFVRVPAGGDCASACTLAFLGGEIRAVSPDAYFVVHAASGFRNDLRLPEKSVRALLDNPKQHLAQVARAIVIAGKGLHSILAYVQRMIDGNVHSDVLENVLDETAFEQYYERYVSGPRYAEDVTQIRQHGRSAVHRIFMRLERNATRFGLRQARDAVERLGARAGAAIRILETMYACRITDQCALDQTTLKEFGYVNIANR